MLCILEKVVLNKEDLLSIIFFQNKSTFGKSHVLTAGVHGKGKTLPITAKGATSIKTDCPHRASNEPLLFLNSAFKIFYDYHPTLNLPYSFTNQ